MCSGGSPTLSQTSSSVKCSKGRPATRFFGEPTQGLTSSNSPYPLADGAELWLASSYEADRTGQLYTAEVHPDVEVVTEWENYLTERDAVLLVALGWLGVSLAGEFRGFSFLLRSDSMPWQEPS